MILKFTENAKKWLLKGEKGVKKGENDENYLLLKLPFTKITFFTYIHQEGVN